MHKKAVAPGMAVQTAGTCSSLNQRRPSALHGRPLRRARRRRVQGQRADPPKVEPGIALVTKAELCGTGCQVGACWWPTTPRGGALRSRRPADGRVRRGPAHHRPKQMVGLATSRVAGELDEHLHCSESGRCSYHRDQPHPARRGLSVDNARSMRSQTVFRPDRQRHNRHTGGDNQRVLDQTAAGLTNARHCALTACQRQIGKRYGGCNCR